MPTPSTTHRTAARIHQDFLDYFVQRCDHTFVPSSPVVPHDDPTLLFTNAGMNQFKEIFLGRGERRWRRAVNSQKCIRAGGKHNDLEDVGKDTYHHTFFEMLGNWSFGDYFKDEAIEWAWDLLTNVWGIDRDRLYVTVFAGDESEGLEPDEEAEASWRRLVPADRISRWGKKDNFWEMGETGPCGPCSEIHYDSRGAAEREEVPGADLVNRGHPDVIEIWNLVFIQFDRGARGQLSPLPSKHVDTGMGFERLVRVLQDKRSNYDTDIWTPIFEAITAHTGARAYRGRLDDPLDIAYRVVADHVRCLAVAIADGALPGNEGRGYVLRRILRRAVRHAHQTLGVEGPLLCDVVPAAIGTLERSFPDLAGKTERIASVIRDEEESFLRTLDRGLALFEEAATRSAKGGARAISADDAFRLHDTFGFPIDLTRVMAEERGLAVDEEGYERLMDEARARSRRGDAAERGFVLTTDAIASLGKAGIEPTRDGAKYASEPVMARVAAIWDGEALASEAAVDAPAAVILDRTNHYAESGGQVGDRGVLERDGGAGRFTVEDAQECAGYVLHVGRLAGGALRVGDEVRVAVDRDHRAPTEANHTGTHLLNHALRAVLGDDVEQRGSLVAPDRLRFDFTCSRAMTTEEITDVEARVNEAIARKLAVDAASVPLETARRIHGVRAVFGERYPDPVRVVSIGAAVRALVEDPENQAWYDFSIEFCGGTHLAGSGAAEHFVIVHEQALAAGVRRITALTGAAAQAAGAAACEFEAEVGEAEALGDDAAMLDAFDDLTARFEHLTIGASAKTRIAPRLETLRERVKAIRKSARGAARGDVVERARAIAGAAAGAAVIVEPIEGADADMLLAALDVIQTKCPDAAAMLLAPDEEAGKVAIAAKVPKTLVARGLKAGDWVRHAAQVCGGGGGGRPDMAQAGGKDPAKVPEAAAAAREFAERVLG